MTKNTYLRRLRWRLRLELTGQKIEPLLAPYVQLFRAGEAAGHTEAALVAECGSVGLAAAEILSTTAPDRVRRLGLRVAALAAVWAVLYRLCILVPRADGIVAAFSQMIGFEFAYALLVAAGAAAAFLLLGGKRLLRVQMEPVGHLLGWHLLSLFVSVGLMGFLMFGVLQPILDQLSSGVPSNYVTGIYRLLAHSKIEAIGPAVARMAAAQCILTGAALLWTGVRAARFGGAYLPLLCVNAGALIAGGQFRGCLQNLTDIASGRLALLQCWNTVWFGFGLALLVGLTVLLARRLKWLHN